MELNIEIIGLFVIIFFNTICHIPLIYGQYVKVKPEQKACKVFLKKNETKKVPNHSVDVC